MVASVVGYGQRIVKRVSLTARLPVVRRAPKTDRGMYRDWAVSSAEVGEMEQVPRMGRHGKEGEDGCGD